MVEDPRDPRSRAVRLRVVSGAVPARCPVKLYVKLYAKLYCGTALLLLPSAAAHGAATWWDSGYLYRKQVTVTAGTAAVPSSYSVSVAFDHASLVSAGKSQADGDDVRIVYWNGSANVELDRALHEASGWNGASTEIWFKTQAAIGATASDSNYYLYYGYSGAGAAPADKAGVYFFYDDFEEHPVGATPDGWTVTVEEGSGTLSVQEEGTDKKMEFTGATGVRRAVFISADATSSLTDFIYETQMRIVVAEETHYGLLFRYADSPNTVYVGVSDPVAGTVQLWKRIASSWIQIGGDWSITPPADTWHDWKVIVSGTNIKVYWDGAYRGEADLGAGELTSGCIGCFPGYFPNPRYDNFKVRKYVNPEPTTGLGGETVSAEERVLAEITVTPAEVTIATGGDVSFTASAVDQFGDPFAATITWSVAPDEGSFSPGTGDLTTYTAGGNAGTFTVKATSGTVEGTATVTVQEPALTTIVVTPRRPDILLGEEQTFTALPLDQFGAGFAAVIDWSVTGGGSVSPATGATSTFTSDGTPGEFTVTASSGAVQGTAKISVLDELVGLAKGDGCLPGARAGLGFTAIALAAAAALARRRRQRQRGTGLP